MQLAERALLGNMMGPAPTPCPVFTAATVGPVIFTAGVPANYNGFGLYNPLPTGTQSAVKLVPMSVSITPSTVSTAANTFGLAKYINTGTAFAPGTGTAWAAGALFQQGVSGTNSGASRALPFGTGTFSTTLPVYVAWLGAAAASAMPPQIRTPLDGDLVVMPGEALIFTQGIAGTALASFSWTEIPL